MFNLRKVTRHVLEPGGATFTVRDSDFLVSDDRDFHPTDVIEDADGSLLVIDTGPWYKLCCPTSQLAKPEGARRDLSRPPHRRTEGAATRAGVMLAWATMSPPTSPRCWTMDGRRCRTAPSTSSRPEGPRRSQRSTSS